MNRFCFFTAILAIAMMSSGVVVHAQTTEPRVFGNNDGFFVITNNKAQFYEYEWESESYNYDSKYDFALPNGYKNVYGFKDFLAFIVNNKLQMYEFNGASWVVFSGVPEFALPDGYERVFSGREKGVICVIVNNKIQIYGNNGRIWGTRPAIDFTLPSGYKNVFGGGDSFGLAVGNKAQFYEFTSAKGWTADSRYDLSLPNGYRYVFGSKDSFMRWSKVFVVFDDSVQVYSFDRDNNKWETDSDWVFKLPKN